MNEPFFRFAEAVVPRAFDVNGPRVTIDGLEHIPEHGGGLLAVNHTGYLDWYPASVAAYRRGRRLRFMIKAEVGDSAVGAFVIKHLGLIPVDRRAGADAYGVAVDDLRAGELVGVHPEGTISRSFELMEFKHGVARMAIDAEVPIVPMIAWGINRIWTKDHPKKLWRNKIPVTLKIGEPMSHASTVDRTNAELHRRMSALLDQSIEEYPHPPGAFWVPRRFGGGAPTPAEAQRLRELELAERARKRAAREAARDARRGAAGGTRWRRVLVPASRRR